MMTSLSFRDEMITSLFEMIDDPHIERIDDLSFRNVIQINYRVIEGTELSLQNDSIRVNYRFLFD